MDGKLQRTQIAEGVFFNSLVDPKFKQNRISANMVLPLEQGVVTVRALLPLLLRRGNADHPDFTELGRVLADLYGADLDADVGKIGDDQILSVSIVSLDDRFALNGEPLVRRCTELLCGALLRPKIQNGRFDEQDVALEKQTLFDVISAEINDKRTYAMRRLDEEMFRGERCGIGKYGRVEDIEAITPELAAEAYQAVLETARIELMFVGCGDPGECRETFAQAFQQVPRGGYRETGLTPIGHANSLREVTDEMEVKQAKLVLGFRPVSVEPAPITARLMCAVFGGTPFSRLFMNVREKLSLCYYCAARYDRVKGVMVVDSGVNFENIAAAKTAILEEFDVMKRGVFTDEEFESAKLSLLNSYNTIPDSASSLELYYLSRILEGEITSPAEEAAMVPGITRDEVVSAAGALRLDTVYLLSGKEGERDGE